MILCYEREETPARSVTTPRKNFKLAATLSAGLDRRIPEFHVLLDNGPTGVSIRCEGAKERREVNIAVPDHGKYFVLDRFFECPFVSPSLVQHPRVAILNMNEAQFIFVLLCLCHGIAKSVDAVASVKAKANIRMRRRIKNLSTSSGVSTYVATCG